MTTVYKVSVSDLWEKFQTKNREMNRIATRSDGAAQKFVDDSRITQREHGN